MTLTSAIQQWPEHTNALKQMHRSLKLRLLGPDDDFEFSVVMLKPVDYGKIYLVLDDALVQYTHIVIVTGWFGEHTVYAITKSGNASPLTT